MIQPPQNRIRLCWLALPLGGAVALVIALMTGGPRAELLTQPPAAHAPQLAFLGPLRLPIRAVWQKLKLRLSGPPRLIALDADIFLCDGTFAFTNLSPTALVLSNRGTRVWLMETNALLALGPQVAQATETIAAGRVISCEDGPPTETGFYRPAGIQFLQSSLRARGTSVEVALFITDVGLFPNEANPHRRWTNFSFGVQVLVPRGFGLLVLNEGKTNGQVAGAIITTEIHRPGDTVQRRPPLRQWRPKSGEKPDYIL